MLVFASKQSSMKICLLVQTLDTIKSKLFILFFLQDETKFELCDTIRTVLRSYPKTNFDGDDIVWMPMLQQGLHDILFSRLGKKQRDPAMYVLTTYFHEF